MAAALFGIVPLNTAGRLQYVLSHSTLDFIREVHGTPWEEDRIRVDELIPTLRARTPAPIEPFYTAYEPETRYEPGIDGSLTAYCHGRVLYTSCRNQFYCYSMLAAQHHLLVEFPFLSDEVAEIGFGLRDSARSDAHGAKPILKKLAARYIPAAWVYASKLQFETPDEAWHRGPFSRWRSILLDDRTAARGLYNQRVVQKLELPRDRELILVATCLELFLRQFIDSDAPARLTNAPFQSPRQTHVL
jgi:hypothetical protein